MEIIKKCELTKKLYRFSCRKCNTVYYANEDEILMESFRNEVTFKCSCLVCNQVNYTDKEF